MKIKSINVVDRKIEKCIKLYSGRLVKIHEATIYQTNAVQSILVKQTNIAFKQNTDFKTILNK